MASATRGGRTRHSDVGTRGRRTGVAEGVAAGVVDGVAAGACSSVRAAGGGTVRAAGAVRPGVANCGEGDQASGSGGHPPPPVPGWSGTTTMGPTEGGAMNGVVLPNA